MNKTKSKLDLDSLQEHVDELLNEFDNELTCKKCSTIGGCPFSYTEECEQIQNYGCLPTREEIISMRSFRFW